MHGNAKEYQEWRKQEPSKNQDQQKQGRQKQEECKHIHNRAAPFAQPTTLKEATNKPQRELTGSTDQATKKRAERPESTCPVTKKIPKLLPTEEETEDEEEDEEVEVSEVAEGMDIRTISTLSKTLSDKDAKISKFRENIWNNLFHGIKFIEKAESLEYGGAISNRMFEKVRGVQGVVDRRSYWSSYCGHTNKTLNEKRGNVNNEIRKAFFGKSSDSVMYLQQEHNTHTHCYIFLFQSPTQKGLAPNRRRTTIPAQQPQILLALLFILSTVHCWEGGIQSESTVSHSF
jgi:hypothetical protein